LIPLLAIIGVLAPPGAPKSHPNVYKKTAGHGLAKKTVPKRLLCHFVRKVSQNGSRGGRQGGSTNHLFAICFWIGTQMGPRLPPESPGDPPDPPGVPQGSPRPPKKTIIGGLPVPIPIPIPMPVPIPVPVPVPIPIPIFLFIRTRWETERYAGNGMENKCLRLRAGLGH